MSFTSSSSSLSDLNIRARAVFKNIVTTYLKTGCAVGSQTLAQHENGGLSAASIRNTMADLTNMGLLSSAHISAGRMPTHCGLRLFVDGLLETSDITAAERRAIDAQLTPKARPSARTIENVLEQTSHALSGLAGGAGLVLAPKTPDDQDETLRHVEFVGLDGGQALAVLVYDNGHVENRIMNVPNGLVPAALERAGNYLSRRLKGKQLSAARTGILQEIRSGQIELDKAARQLVELGIASWSGNQSASQKKGQMRNLIVRGRAKLLDNQDIRSDLERIRLLFEDLEKKEELIALLDQAQAANGIKIFIGAENPLFSLSGSSMVVAPYKDTKQRIIGAVGVIGPMRLNYARVIPMVDYTASVVGRLVQKERAS